MRRKLKVGILFGGRSVEHEVSLQSAKNIFAAIDRTKYIPVPVAVTKKGQWLILSDKDFLLNPNNPKTIKLNIVSNPDNLMPERVFSNGLSKDSQGKNFVDVVFPVLHGPFGEDGTVQGLLKLANVPFVGASVLGSAVGMDKDVMKRLLREAKLPVTDFITFFESDQKKIDYKEVVKRLGLPIFVKPASLGSSVGVSKVIDLESFKKAIKTAFLYDRKILVEKAISGRELECAVLGNDTPVASIVGEIIPRNDFYSYSAKYLDENGAELSIPAKISKKTLKSVQEMAVETFKVLNCEGMARVDFFLSKNDKLIINEINTIPGFTKISMYPKLWEESGISYTDLISRLIELALERFKNEQKLKTSINL